MKNHRILFTLFLMVIVIVMGTGCSLKKTEKKKTIKKTNNQKANTYEEEPPWVKDVNIKNYEHLPEEYQEKVQLADIYVNHVYYSKEATIFILKNVENFSDKEVKYALSHIKKDWKRNALYSAKELQESNKWGKAKIAKELSEEYYGIFTKSEIEYALKHIDEARTTQLLYTPKPANPGLSKAKYQKIIDKWKKKRIQEEKENYNNSLWWYNFDSSKAF